MLLYTAALIFWIFRWGRGGSVGFRRPVGSWIPALPLLILPGYNLLTWGEATLDLPDVLLMVAVAATEEIFFRGFLLDFLAKRGRFSGVFWTSILFALLHGLNLLQGADPEYTWMQMIWAFGMGLCYGAATIRMESILPCILAHCAVNVTGLCASWPPQPGWETIILWVCVAICICWGLRQSLIIRKFDKEI